MRTSVLIKDQGGIPANPPPGVHGLDVPARSVLVGVLQLIVSEVADVWIAALINLSPFLLAPTFYHEKVTPVPTNVTSL